MITGSLREGWTRFSARTALVMLMTESRKAQGTERHVTDDAREWLAFQTVTGDKLTILKPNVSEEQLEQMKALAREVLRDDSSEPGIDLP